VVKAKEKVSSDSRWPLDLSTPIYRLDCLRHAARPSAVRIVLPYHSDPRGVLSPSPFSFAAITRNVSPCSRRSRITEQLPARPWFCMRRQRRRGRHGHIIPVHATSFVSSRSGNRSSRYNHNRRFLFHPCRLRRKQFIKHISSCSLTGPDSSYASATVSASFTLGVSSIGTNAQATDGALSSYSERNGQLAGNLGSAHSTISIDANIQTAGPVRAGYVLVQIPYPIWGYDDPGGFVGVLNWSLGNSISGNCFDSSPPCFPFFPALLPFTLGTAVQFTESETVGGDPYPDNGDSGTDSTNVSLQLSFFEADGITPVAVSELVTAPEPGSYGLLAVGLFGLGVMTRRGLLYNRIAYLKHRVVFPRFDGPYIPAPSFAAFLRAGSIGHRPKIRIRIAQRIIE
jgi:hypothetical protein